MTADRLPLCEFLIPVARDSDRKPHPPVVWRLLEEELQRTFGGHTGPRRVMGFMSIELVPGSWTPAGTEERISDESRLYSVIVAENRVDELRSLLRRAANSFDQRTMLLIVAGIGEYLDARPEDGFL
jgi:hypothetical protein